MNRMDFTKNAQIFVLELQFYSSTFDKIFEYGWHFTINIGHLEAAGVFLPVVCSCIFYVFLGPRKHSFSGISAGGFTTLCWQTTWRNSSCHTGKETQQQLLQLQIYSDRTFNPFKFMPVSKQQESAWIMLFFSNVLGFIFLLVVAVDLCSKEDEHPWQEAIFLSLSDNSNDLDVTLTLSDSCNKDLDSCSDLSINLNCFDQQEQFAWPELQQHWRCRPGKTVCSHITDANWWQHHEVWVHFDFEPVALKSIAVLSFINVVT